MKILILTSGTIGSSLSARIVNLGSELVKSGNSVSIIAPSSDKYNNFKKDRTVKINEIKIIHPFQFYTNSQTLNMIPYIFSVMVKMLFIKSDIVYIYKPTPITIIGLISKLKRKKIITDIDDLGNIVMERENNPKWKVILVGLSESTSAKMSDSIIVASSYLFKAYKDKFPNKKIEIIPNGTTVVNNPVTKIKTNPNIIFLGSINSKNILDPLFKVLPNVFKNNANIKLKIIGDGKEINYFKELSEKLKISKNVEFIGWVEKNNLQNYLRTGDLGYCVVPNTPAYKAASNQKVFDYMSYGVIPVVNNVGDLIKYIAEGKAGYIVENNLIKAIQFAVGDKSGRDRKIKYAKKYVVNEYSWKILANKLQAIFEEVIK